ncbi:MAG: hypothetical protein J1G06_06530 [Oscillospiraceae bacterium]|nr:hypothetical protein [Oscillospiraceae bacterium]
MKYYNDYDYVPMNFHKFYIRVRLPLMVVLNIVNIIVRKSNGIVLSLQLLEILTAICICVGLGREEYWGYMVNKIFIIVEAVLGIVVLGLGAYGMYLGYSEFAEDIGTGLGLIVPHIFIFIYFEKRRYLFTGAPKQRKDVPIYAGDTCLIRILHLNGTTSEQVENISKFNFNYSKFIDETGTIYFREEVRNGQTVNIATTKEKWIEAVLQNFAPKYDK